MKGATGSSQKRRDYIRLKILILLLTHTNMFFGIFTRKKIESWEIEFLLKVFSSMGDPISASFAHQVNSGILKGVRISVDDKAYSVAFIPEALLIEKYLDTIDAKLQYSNIRVKNLLSDEVLSVTISVTYGLINRYYFSEKVGKYQFDNSKIDLSRAKIIRLDNKAYLEIEQILSKKEQKHINKSVVCPIELKGMIYYQIKDLGDGDFIGITLENRIYEIRHDSLEIMEIDRSKLLHYLT